MKTRKLQLTKSKSYNLYRKRSISHFKKYLKPQTGFEPFGEKSGARAGKGPPSSESGYTKSMSFKYKPATLEQIWHM